MAPKQKPSSTKTSRVKKAISKQRKKYNVTDRLDSITPVLKAP
jgi:hypothetical protein